MDKRKTRVLKFFEDSDKSLEDPYRDNDGEYGDYQDYNPSRADSNSNNSSEISLMSQRKRARNNSQLLRNKIKKSTITLSQRKSVISKRRFSSNEGSCARSGASSSDDSNENSNKSTCGTESSEENVSDVDENQLDNKQVISSCDLNCSENVFPLGKKLEMKFHSKLKNPTSNSMTTLSHYASQSKAAALTVSKKHSPDVYGNQLHDEQVISSCDSISNSSEDIFPLPKKFKKRLFSQLNKPTSNSVTTLSHDVPQTVSAVSAASPSNDMPQLKAAASATSPSHDVPQPEAAASAASPSHDMPQLKAAASATSPSHDVPQPEAAASATSPSHDVPQSEAAASATSPSHDVPQPEAAASAT